MPTKVKAVYEGGVLRPLEPLDFTEKTPVKLTIELLPQRSVAALCRESEPIPA